MLSPVFRWSLSRPFMGPSIRAENSSNFAPAIARLSAPLILLLCIQGASAQTSEHRDPLEGINRDIYNLNVTIDKYLFKPVAQAYRWLLPNAAELAVGRVFDNLEEVGSAVNNLGQGKGYAAANNTGRFLVNSTIGVLGLMDVAEPLGLEKEDFEDFGQTLAVWGVKSGPYLMLPFIGPSTLRDGPAFMVDSRMLPQRYLEDIGARNTARGVDLISIRAKYIDADQALPEKDPYTFVRDAYFQRRDYLIKDGQIEDDFGADGSDDFLD
jgi:phospholipid-binding lipoprotein MlaA